MQRSNGLSLVEMMVVLVIVGIVTALLVEGLGNALLLYERVSSRQVDRFSQALEIDWWRESVAGAAPNRWQKPLFIGTPYSVALESYQPLLGPAGLVTGIEWRIVGDRLVYVEVLSSGDYSQAVPLFVGEGAVFGFMDDDGVWFDRWPRRDGDLEIPVRVRLETPERTIVADIYSHASAVVYPDEIAFGGVE